MPRILIGNCFTDEVAGDPRLLPTAHLQTAAASAQLLIWFAKAGDIVVLPCEPEREHVDYVTTLTGTDPASLHLLVPPAGIVGTDLLTADRLADPEFRAALTDAIAGREISEVVTLTPEASVVELARDLGFLDKVAGHEFIGQGGGRLLNSKAIFRAVAAGSGVPLPEGGVCTNKVEAEILIEHLFAKGYSVMLKRDYACGGAGNEIVSQVGGFQPVGAERVVVLADRAAVRTYLDERWDWVTNERRFPAVIERYVPGSRGIFVEFTVTDDGPVFSEHGEMLSAPTANAQVIPSPALPPRALPELVAAGGRLCESLRMLGFRGQFCADAIVTETGEVLFTEYNGRITGSTHIYTVIGRELVGPDYANDRVLVEYCGWQVPSYQAAVERLAESGLAFDRGSRTGVVLVKAFSQADGTVRYCAIAEDFAAAEKTRELVEGLFSPAAA
jgi:Pre ATP-grasp domain/PGM1 C-terminal domain